jgi:plasmid stabilization system protein ParE
VAYRVVYTPDAEDQIAAILAFVAEESSPETAASFVDGLARLCDSLAAFPFRGTRVGNPERGVRMLVHRGRATVAYAMDGDTVLIVGVFYAGRNWRRAFD